MRRFSSRPARWVMSSLACLGAVLVFVWAPVSTAKDANPAIVQVAENDTLGRYLTDGNGRTLYFFAADSRGVSNCYDFCAKSFPALTTEGRPVAGDGILSAFLGTLERKDGTTQVTYSGHPLYYFSGDLKPGSTAGAGAKNFGDDWFALAPNGKIAKATAASRKKSDDAGQKAAASGEAGGNPFADDAQAAAAGKKLYLDVGCYGCHGRGGGGGMGPSLVDREWRYGGGSDAAVFQSIKDGRPRGMPAWGSRLSDEEIWQIITFLRSISE